MSERKESWVEGANGPQGFGLNHLPMGAFVPGDERQGAGACAPRLCVRIGEMLLDLYGCVADDLFDALSGELRAALQQPTLHAFLALGEAAWAEFRESVMGLLADDAPGGVRVRVAPLLRAVVDCELVLPIAPRGFTDFYASVDHARRVGELFRPEAPLLPNYKHVPVAYNGRASSVVASGTAIARPWGQQRPGSEAGQPGFAPTAALDYELELAFVVGQGNALGSPIAMEHAAAHVFGVALLNDWSARDVQAWEYQPLGPFLGKSFATSLSPWITPLAALEGFRVPSRAREADDPQLLPYLDTEADRKSGALDMVCSVSLTTEASRAAGRPPMQLSRSNARELYWTAAQMVAHQTSNGCNLQAGDLLATGTISGAERESAGCLLELSRNGREPITLPNGERRNFLLDGDEVILTARCEREGQQGIVLGECRGRIAAALTRRSHRK